MKQQELFTSEQVACKTSLTDKQVQDMLVGEILDLAKGKLDAVGTAVRKVLNKHYYTHVRDRARWIYLANTLTRRVKRTLRDSEKCRRTPLRSSHNRVRA